MAITRAQIARELYKNGKRVGLKGGADASTESFSKSFDKQHGTNTVSKATKDNSVNVGAGGANTKGDDGRNDNLNVPSSNTGITQKEKKKYQKQFTSKGKAPPGPNQKKRQRALDYVNRGLARYLDRFEEYYDEDDFGITKTGYPNFGFPNIYDAIGDELIARKNIKEIKKTGNKIPVGTSGNSYELSAIPDLDIDSIRELASVQTTKQGAPLTGYQANALEDLKRNIENRDTFLETGDTSVIYPDPPEATKTGPDPDPVDPCLGPNPPAYCAVNNDPTDPATPKRNLGGLAPRFAGSIFDFTGLADGGRAGKMDGGMMEDTPEGGIMDLESGRQMYFLGKLVKKATRAVKKVAKSPIGKAALLYFGGGALGNLAGGSGLGGMFKGAMSPGQFFTKNKLANVFTKGGAKNILFGGQKLMGNAAKNNFVDFSGILGSGGKFSLGKTLGLSLGVPFALDALGVGKEDDKMDLDEYYKTQGIDIDAIRNNPYRFLARRFVGMADGGRINYQEGGDAEPVAKKTMPLLDMDGMEKDYREDGGFVPIGRMERADDVPARLSKNEFVFTADAVRNAGDGDIDKGAEVMYNMMKNLESGGEVSEESQGLNGAKEMFKTSQRLEEVL